MSNSPTVLEKTMYTATATAVAGRDGNVKSDDGKLDLSLTPPKEMGGSGAGTNPEQLFRCGYAGCFGSAFAHVARLQRSRTGPVHTDSKGLDRPCRKGPSVLPSRSPSTRPSSRARAGQALLETAHQVCPYSNATRGNIVVDVKLA